MIKKMLIFLISFIPVATDARILMGPWLQAITMNSVWVLVECDSKDSALVVFWSEPEKRFSVKSGIIDKTTADPTTFIHKIEISGLFPATRCFYQVSQDGTTTSENSFFTAVEPGMPFRMVWMADNRTGTVVFNDICRLMKRADPMVALYGGDLCSDGSYDAWKREFFTPELLRFNVSVPFFNTPGNHERWKQNTKAFTHNPLSLSGTQDFYSFDYGDLHILSLNTELPLDSGSAQARFAGEDLKSTRKPWKIVMMHEPAYCSGGHGENAGLIALGQSVFEPNGVDFVLAGHSHFYQRNEVNGITYLVMGTAGAPLYQPTQAIYTKFQAKEHHFAILDISSTRIKIFIYNEKNELLEMVEKWK